MMDAKSKFSGSAHGFTERSYANAREFMSRRAILVMGWGTPMNTGDRVLELGCGDGYLGCLLAQRGLRYKGLDIAEGMVTEAKCRAQNGNLSAFFEVADLNSYHVNEPTDAVIGFMHAFFRYIKDPYLILKQIYPHVQKKIIIDWNHYCPMDLNKALKITRKAGYRVTWRPFFCPMTRELTQSIQQMFYLAENIPIIRSIPLQWKFTVLLKGEIN